MKLTSLLAASVIVLRAVASTPSDQSDGDRILADISDIETKLAVVRSNVDRFQGGPLSVLQALTIASASKDLNQALHQAAIDAESSAPLEGQVGASITVAVTALQPEIFGTLSALTSKKDGFSTAALGLSAVPIVHNTLAKMRANTARFGDQLTAKMVPELRKAAPLVTSNIDFHYQRTIDAFTSSDQPGNVLTFMRDQVSGGLATVIALLEQYILP